MMQPIIVSILATVWAVQHLLMAGYMIVETCRMLRDGRLTAPGEQIFVIQFSAGAALACLGVIHLVWANVP
ncbi:MAG: hypothetical protein HKO62_06465 [Gammaproteobacteria bacterium]|nr:hypothetical protein [Gammaproteobacteria bacterium]